MRRIVQRFMSVGSARSDAAMWGLVICAAIWHLYVALLLTTSACAPVGVSLSVGFTSWLLIASRSAFQNADWLAVTSSRNAGAANRPATIGSSFQPTVRRVEVLGREDLIAHLDGLDLTGGAGQIGIIRFANHAPMVAFDASGARRVMELFSQRLTSAAGRRLVVQLTDDACGIWLDLSHEAAVDELKSLGYVSSQEVTGFDLTVAPDIQLGLMSFPAEGHNARSAISHALATCSPLRTFAKRVRHGRALEDESPALQFAMEQALRRAVRAGELSLRYQPLIDTSAGCVGGAEVLLRWRHPVFGDVSPAVFVPLLERAQLIHEIGLWTLNSACRQLSQWRTAGYPHLKLAINLSTVQLQEPTLKDAITRVVASHGLVPSDVELELTETAAMESRDETAALFQDLRSKGFGIALDDFGNGHSNFAYLRSLPFSKLKIDREFVSHIDTRPGSQAICKSLLELGAGLGIAVLAEGVERAEEVTCLRKLGCHLFQGYYFDRPQTADDFTARLTDVDWLSKLASDVHRGRAELTRRLQT
jgi:EAL domain-containing protein (putative c-di-GMP-specific phosphodiesterase class I)